MFAKNKPNEIQIIRVYDAPVKMVWEAWVDPEQVAQWWGPRGFTLTTKQKDVRVGGTWTYTMHGPDGVDYPNKTTFHEVEKYKRLVYDHGASETTPPMFRVTVNFSEHKGKTTMEMTMALPTAEEAKKTKKFVKEAGGNATWDRLAEFLSDKDKFVINRSFEAPIDTVFDAWTKPEHLVKWSGPAGSQVKYLHEDIRAGGEAFYTMTGGGMGVLFGKAKYLEITRPSRLVYTQVFCDESGQVIRHPMAPTWPETMLTTVTFTQETLESTRVTIEWEVYGEASDVERDTFRQARGGMTQGWTGSLDKLEDLLTKV